jgi:MFS family permease
MTRLSASQNAAALSLRKTVAVFLVFAFAYFFSALLRAVTATLAPVFSAELGLSASHLGLLAGAYFLGFACMQLPLGSALDRHGPKRVLLALLALAVLGCAAFALAQGLVQLIVARLLIGVGVSACLMAPLTAYRHLFSPGAQLRSNSWMLMTGSFGMVASTLPVQWLLPLLGWRGLFWAVAACLGLGMLLIAAVAPRDESTREPARQPAPDPNRAAAAAEPDRPGPGYGEVLRHPMFRRLVPLGFFTYGGMVAMQALWIGPWLTQVAGRSAGEAAAGLLLVNGCMLFAFLGWGLAMPHLVRLGWTAERLVAVGWPLSVLVLGAIVVLGPQAGAAWWALWCVVTSAISVSQPAIGQAFAAALAGRALSAYNLVIFAGVFAIQWGIGLVIDLLKSQGWATLPAFRAAFALFMVLGLAAGLVHWWRMPRAADAGPVAAR